MQSQNFAKLVIGLTLHRICGRSHCYSILLNRFNLNLAKKYNCDAGLRFYRTEISSVLMFAQLIKIWVISVGLEQNR
jgi:hypothetical protein